MSARGTGDPQSSRSPDAVTRRSWLRRTVPWLLTLIAGIVIGGVCVGFLTSAHGPLPLQPEPVPTTTITATAPPRTDAYVIPADCLKLLEHSQAVSALLSRGAAAAADIDAARLATIVREAEKENEAVTSDDAACRAGVATPTVSGSG